MDARSAKADPSNLLRKVVVVRLKGEYLGTRFDKLSFVSHIMEAMLVLVLR